MSEALLKGTSKKWKKRRRSYIITSVLQRDCPGDMGTFLLLYLKKKNIGLAICVRLYDDQFHCVMNTWWIVAHLNRKSLQAETHQQLGPHICFENAANEKQALECFFKSVVCSVKSTKMFCVIACCIFFNSVLIFNRKYAKHNAWVRLYYHTSHVTPIMISLHWLPIRFRIPVSCDDT